jgi:hypothetical protein
MKLTSTNLIEIGVASAVGFIVALFFPLTSITVFGGLWIYKIYNENFKTHASEQLKCLKDKINI